MNDCKARKCIENKDIEMEKGSDGKKIKAEAKPVLSFPAVQ